MQNDGANHTAISRGKKPRRSLLRQLSGFVLRMLLGIVVAFLGYNLLSMIAASQEGKAALQFKNGIAPGAVPRTLGDAHASGAVLFVHGFVGGANNFAQVPDRVAAAGWHVYVMRLPGHGTSPKDFAETRPDELIEAVRKETQRLAAQYETVLLVGHSMGGAISTIGASEENVDGLVLAAPYYGVTHRWYYGLRPETWIKIGAVIMPYAYKGKFFLQVNRKEAKNEVYSYVWVPSKGLQTLTELGGRACRLDVVTKVSCPVLWLHGSGDVAASPEAAREAFRLMPHPLNKAVTLKASNHHLFWDYDRERVLDEILRFAGTPESWATP